MCMDVLRHTLQNWSKLAPGIPILFLEAKRPTFSTEDYLPQVFGEKLATLYSRHHYEILQEDCDGSIVRLFIEQSAVVNAGDEDGCTALTTASRRIWLRFLSLVLLGNDSSICFFLAHALRVIENDRE
jgi:hypothetical protein